MGMLVSFTLVFYFGYCYNRYWEQYMKAMGAKNAILNCCSMVASTYMNHEDMHTMWRYLQLIQCSAYVGLSMVCTRENFFNGFCQKHSLLMPNEAERLSAIGLPAGKGGRAYREFCVWAMKLNTAVFKKGQLDPPTRAGILGMISKLSDDLEALYDFRGQVLPYAYVHEVSLATSLYLTFFAIAKARMATPDADIIVGIVLPCCSVIYLTWQCISLILVGAAVQDPFGTDPEDFAILDYCESSAATSRRIIEAGMLAPHAPMHEVLDECMWDSKGQPVKNGLETITYPKPEGAKVVSRNSSPSFRRRGVISPVMC